MQTISNEQQSIIGLSTRVETLALVDEASKNEAIALATALGVTVGKYEIEDEGGYHYLVLCGGVLTAVEKKLVAWHKERTDAAFRSHKQAVADAKQEIAPITAAKMTAGSKIRVFEIEQERIRRENERLLQEAAKKLADEEALAQAEEVQRQMLEQGSTVEEAAVVVEEVIQEAIARPAPRPMAAAAYTRATDVRKPTVLWSASITSVREMCKDIERLCGTVGETEATSYVVGITKNPVTGILSSPALNKLATRRQNVNVGVVGVIGVSNESKPSFK